MTKFLTSTAIVLAAGLAAGPAAAQYMAPPPPPPQTMPRVNQDSAEPAKTAATEGKITVSSKASKAIGELQTAVRAKDFANVPAKVAAAEAVAQTKDDKYAIGLMQREAAMAANDNVALASATERLANSGFLDSAKVTALYLDLGAHQFNAKQYAQAVASFQRASALSPNDPQALELLAQGMNAAGQKAEAGAVYQRLIQARLSAGQKPAEDMYKQAVGIAYGARSPNSVELARQWVAAYPSADSWSNALAVYRNLDNPDPSSLIDILRLARITDAMKGTGDFHAYAYEAANEANYGEAKSLIAEGIASGKIKASDPIIQEIQGVLKSKPTPTAADLATAEKGASVPTAFLRVGDRYYGAGNFAKAADLYRQAMAKGVDKNLANLRIGEALARSGDKAGATAAFNAVTGPLADVAKFWMLYVQRQA